MDESGSHLALDDGTSHELADWESAAAAVLRKAHRLAEDAPDHDVWSELAVTTLDGISVTPLGTPDLLTGLETDGRPVRQGDWDVRAYVGPGDTANREALTDLEGGVTSLWLGSGHDVSAVLDGVLLDLAPVVLDGDSATVQALLDHAGDQQLHRATNLGFRAEPATGDHARLATDAGVLGFVVDATGAHDAGASDAQELGWSLAVAAAYLRNLEADGVEPEQAAQLVEFRYAVTDEQFASIAKLRAARRLWSRMLELCGVELVAQRQHAVTSRPMMSRYDPYTNVLRTTVAAFAAGVGGADAVTVLPFDSPLGRPGTLGRRLARNVSHLLVQESHLAVVADPAGGAYAVEKLTDDLTRAAWVELGRIEQDGLEAFDERVAETAAARDQQVATRVRPITGLSEFPAPDETLPEREPDGAWDGVRSYGSAFEAMRDDPADGPVFLATMGPLASYSARAGFATNLFTAGGVGISPAGPTEGVADVVAAYDNQPVVCLAGTDATYAEWGTELVAALREAGATWVAVAGRSATSDGRSLGVDDVAAVGVDAVAFLTTVREKLR